MNLLASKKECIGSDGMAFLGLVFRTGEHYRHDFFYLSMTIAKSKNIMRWLLLETVGDVVRCKLAVYTCHARVLKNQ
jgi:hypothetical protein